MITKIEKATMSLSVGTPFQNFEFYSTIVCLTAVVIFQIKRLSGRTKINR